MLPKAIFVDKDGTLVENVPYNVDPEQIRLTEGALEGLRLLHQNDYKLIIISNQSGVAHGKFKEEDLIPVETHLRKVLGEAEIPLAGFYYCPHHPDGKVHEYGMHCFCRKPSPGLLFRAAREHGLNLARSWMIGDILNDVEAGRRADCRTVLINNGNETEWKLSVLRQPNHQVSNLLEAAHMILDHEKPSPFSAVRTTQIHISTSSPST